MIAYFAALRDLEAMVDRYSLSDVLSVLMEICDGKAEHLAVNWQDHAAAKQWARCAVVLDSAAAQVAKEHLP